MFNTFYIYTYTRLVNDPDILVFYLSYVNEILSFFVYFSVYLHLLSIYDIFLW